MKILFPILGALGLNLVAACNTVTSPEAKGNPTPFEPSSESTISWGPTNDEIFQYFTDFGKICAQFIETGALNQSTVGDLYEVSLKRDGASVSTIKGSPGLLGKASHAWLTLNSDKSNRSCKATASGVTRFQFQENAAEYQTAFLGNSFKGTGKFSNRKELFSTGSKLATLSARWVQKNGPATLSVFVYHSAKTNQ